MQRRTRSEGLFISAQRRAFQIWQSFAREPEAEEVKSDAHSAQEGSSGTPTRLIRTSLAKLEPTLGCQLHRETLLGTTLLGMSILVNGTA